MQIIEEIRNSKRKPKELVAYLADRVKRDKSLFDQLLEGLEHPKIPLRGLCAEVMAEVTKEKPELFPAQGCDAVIRHLADKAPRVKWETAQLVGNVAAVWPEKAGAAVPALLLNADDEGTVVRWSAAYALTRIAGHNAKLRRGLIQKMEAILKKESNNGVKNVYLKGLKKIARQD